MNDRIDNFLAARTLSERARLVIRQNLTVALGTVVLMAAAANKLALEAELITSEPEMAESLASVVRGLISLMAFNEDMDPEAVAMLQGTKVEARGNSLSISVAIDPDLVVRTISD